jgi:integrase
MGYLYQRRQRDGTKGGPWWIKYYVNNRPVYESTHTDKKKQAEDILKDREGKAVTGQPIIPGADRIRYDEIAEDLRRHYETSGERNLDEADDRLKPLKQFFAGRRVVEITTSEAEKYAQKRQRAGVANSTINRELSMLTKMLKFAFEAHKCLRVPIIHKLKEPAPRQGFFEQDQFQAVRRRLREDLQVAVTIAYTFGWRMQSEVLGLERRHLDLEAGTLRLDPGTTKNADGRLIYLTPEVSAMLAAQLERVRGLERQLGSIVPYLFPHLKGRYRGKPIGEFYKTWRTACRQAHVPGRIPHDFRHTAVRNMVNAGVPERVAMTVTGHKTRSVFDRYHIVSPGDLQDVARRLTVTAWGQQPSAALDSAR